MWCGGKRTCKDSKDHPEKCKRCLQDNRKCCFHQRSNQGKKDQGDTQGRYLSKDQWNKEVPLQAPSKKYAGKARSTEKSVPNKKSTKKKLTDKPVPKKKSTTAKAKRPAKKPCKTAQSRKAGESAQSKDDLEDSVALSGLGSSHLNLSGPTRSGRQVIPPPYYKPPEQGDPQAKRDRISVQEKAPSGRPAKRDRKSTKSKVPDGKKDIANWTFPHSIQTEIIRHISFHKHRSSIVRGRLLPLSTHVS